MDIGVQIFGCLEQCRKNPQLFFKRLAEAGYHQIETCILFDDEEKMKAQALAEGNTVMAWLAEILWKPWELPEFRRQMGQYGLKLSAVHVFASNLLNVLPSMIETAGQNDIETYVVNCDQETIASSYLEFGEVVGKSAEMLGEKGIALWIHNNGEEIRAKTEYNGIQQPVLTALLDQCKASGVGAQVDVGWVLFGGIDPVEYLDSIQEQVKSIHFKDLKKDFPQRQGSDRFACLGEGALCVDEILQWADKHTDISILIDQDASDGDIMEDLEKSASLLWKKLQGK